MACVDDGCAHIIIIINIINKSLLLLLSITNYIVNAKLHGKSETFLLLFMHQERYHSSRPFSGSVLLVLLIGHFSPVLQFSDHDFSGVFCLF